MREKILGALKGILQKHLKDKQFQRLLKKENQLARDLTTAVQERIKELKTKSHVRNIPSVGLRADLRS